MQQIKNGNKHDYSKILNQQYNLSGKIITEIEGGWSARAFKVDTTNGSFFLKAYEKHKGATKKWTALVDSYMPIVLWLDNNTNLHGKIICPVLTNDGEYKCEDDKFIYLLFPYIEGYTLYDTPMSAVQITEMAEIISELHKYGEEIPVDTSAIKEDFAVPFCDELRELILLTDKPDASETMSILKEYKTILIANIEKIETLAVKLTNENLPNVLCHTDVHGWNLMQSGRLILIDWEGMKLAPPEADLFAFVGNRFWHNCSEQFIQIYKKAHPNFEINNEALDFYQTGRRIEDICAFAKGLLYEDISDEERRQSLYHLHRECSIIS